jgi:nucleoside-diphosphate-sugar epimerase
LRFQAVHTDDVAAAYRLALTKEAKGAFNIAADPVLGTATVAAVLKAREAALPAGAVRRLAGAAWRLRLSPTPPGWLDLAVGTPVLDSSKARDELGWKPEHTAIEALEELLEGLREGAGGPTPPLAPRSRLRLREVLTGVGARNP